MSSVSSWMAAIRRRGLWTPFSGMPIASGSISFCSSPTRSDRIRNLQARPSGPYGPLRYGGADLSYVTEAQSIPRELLRVAADQVLLATVGNHLPSRMSDAFCRTVAAVLRGNENAIYLVIGPGNFERQRALFGDL